MNTTDKTILAASKATAEVDDAESWEEEFAYQNTDGHLEEEDAGFYMEALYSLELLDKVSFFLHETCFLFWSMLLHFGSNFLKMLFAQNIFFAEQIFNFFTSCKLGFSEILFSASPFVTAAATTLVAGLWDHTDRNIFLKTVFNRWFSVGFQTIFVMLRRC